MESRLWSVDTPDGKIVGLESWRAMIRYMEAIEDGADWAQVWAGDDMVASYTRGRQ